MTGREAIIVGPTGSEVSFDQGHSWQSFDSGSFHTVDCAGGHACWASGAQGRGRVPRQNAVINARSSSPGHWVAKKSEWGRTSRAFG